MTHIAIALVSFGSLLFTATWWVRRQLRRADARLLDWVDQRRYRLLDVRPAPFARAPRRPGARKNKQIIYRVVLADEYGTERTGLIKLGSKTFGVLTREIPIEWELSSARRVA
ncbi:MAG: hypothetical protein ABW321_08200 [Polyangiales bacterium]